VYIRIPVEVKAQVQSANIDSPYPHTMSICGNAGYREDNQTIAEMAAFLDTLAGATVRESFTALTESWNCRARASMVGPWARRRQMSHSLSFEFSPI